MPTSTFPQPPKKRGCLFYGCLGLAVLSLLAVVLVYLGYRFAVNKFDSVTKDFTDTAPAAIETVEVREAQLRSIQERVLRFTEALESSRSSELILTADDINALISSDPNFKDARQRLFVRIDGDKVRSQVSWPLQDIGPLKLRGRYLNGEATLNLAFTNGVLFVGIADVTVKEKSLPSQFLAPLKQQNFAKDAMNDPKTAENLAKFERIEVRDGKIILRSRPGGRP
jgi:hypothetical protein